MTATNKNSALPEEKDNTMAMLLMAGMVVSSAGFAMYTRQADALLKRMSSASKIQGIQKASNLHLNRPTTKLAKPPKGKTFHEKDDFF